MICVRADFDPKPRSCPAARPFAKECLVGSRMFRNGMPVRQFPVAVSRVFLQQGGDKIIIWTPVQIMVLRAEHMRTGLAIPASAIRLSPLTHRKSGFLHRGFRFGLQAAGKMRALRVEEAEGPHIVGDGEESPRRVSRLLRGGDGLAPVFPDHVDIVVRLLEQARVGRIHLLIQIEGRRGSRGCRPRCPGARLNLWRWFCAGPLRAA